MYWMAGLLNNILVYLCSEIIIILKHTLLQGLPQSVEFLREESSILIIHVFRT